VDMLALLVVANPSPNSLSHAMASTAQRVLVTRGYEIAYHDLYAEHFDPVQPTGEVDTVCSSNGLVEQHCSELAIHLKRSGRIVCSVCAASTASSGACMRLYRVAPLSSAPHGFRK
jgi:hypothetical protein